MRAWFLPLAACLLAGCTTTVELPLCPKLAELSYPTAAEGQGKFVGRFVEAAATERNIKITPLNYFVAEFEGPRHQIAWLRKHYATLVTTFNPKLVTEDEQYYMTAHEHVQSWITLIEQKRYQELMVGAYYYCPTCCTNAEMTKRLQLAPKQ